MGKTGAGAATRTSGRSKRPGRPAKGRDDVRSLILSKTCELLNSTPPDRLSVMMVARALDIDAALVRYYFKSRSGLLVAAAEQLNRAFYDAFDKAVSQSDGAPQSLLRARIALLFSFELNYPYYYRLMAEEVAHSPLPEAQALRAEVERRGGMQFDAILASADVRPVDGRFLRIAILGAVEFFRQGPAYVGDAATDPEAYQDFLVDMIMNGLLKRP